MKSAIRNAAIAAAALVLTACTSLVADLDSADAPKPKLTVNGCPVGEEWTRESVAAALNLAPHTITALKDLRGLSLEEMCTMPPRRLARAVFRVSGKQRPDSPRQGGRVPRAATRRRRRRGPARRPVPRAAAAARAPRHAQGGRA
jgi:hypothetical protein